MKCGNCPNSINLIKDGFVVVCDSKKCINRYYWVCFENSELIYYSLIHNNYIYSSYKRCSMYKNDYFRIDHNLKRVYSINEFINIDLSDLNKSLEAISKLYMFT